MKSFLSILILLCLLPVNMAAQDQDTRVLLTINGTDITAAEFLWQYEKNNSGSNISSLEEYLDLFILFKMKVEAAKEDGFDLTESFKNELSGYRTQLSKNYLSDQEVKEELLRKAYERSTEEINAYHILIKCAPDSSPADTAAAFEKALNIRERIRLGEPFASVARGASDDPAVRINGGNLGYFTVFQTPFNFENAAYSMKPGNLSKPIRTAEGYHIIKVQDRRPNSGKIRVAHIMKSTPSGSSEIQVAKAKTAIDSIYQLVISGSDFGKLAGEYSDDRGSSSSGGVLPWFGTGEMITDFAENSFKLLHDGDISLPFQTIYGWHIVKRLGKESPPPYEEARRILESKMSQSYLESVSRKSFVESLKKEYNFKVNQANLNWLCSIADSAFRSGDYKWESKSIPNSLLYSFEGGEISMDQFTRFITLAGSRAFSNDSIRFINNLVEIKAYEDLIKYEDSILESKYPEFGYLMREFHDGILLFEISNKEIWSKISSDSVGQKRYWDTQKERFLKESSLECKIYTISPQAGKNRTRKLTKELKKRVKADSDDSHILDLGRSGSSTLIKIDQGVFKRGENRIVDQLRWTKGISVTADNTGTHIVYVSKINEAELLSFEEARPLLIDDYQMFLENSWRQQLRERYSVKINDGILRSINQKER